MTILWIASFSLGGIILALLFAPALEVTLTRRIVNPLLIAALLLAIAIIFSNGAAYATDTHMLSMLGVTSGILVGTSLFVVSLACARIALGEIDMRSAATTLHSKDQE